MIAGLEDYNNNNNKEQPVLQQTFPPQRLRKGGVSKTSSNPNIKKLTECTKKSLRKKSRGTSLNKACQFRFIKFKKSNKSKKFNVLKHCCEGHGC